MNPARLLCMSLLAMAAFSANATVITFDDLEPPPPQSKEDPYASRPVLDDQYSHLGITFTNSYYFSSTAGGEEAVVSPPHALIGRSVGFEFTGASDPDFVSFYVTTLLEDAPFVSIYDPAGELLEQRAMDGWQGTPETSTPWQPKQFVEISYPAIGAIMVAGLFDRPFGTVIDDITFEYPATVSTPATGGLLLIGLLGLLATRARRRMDQSGA